jgi:hypothetical protein
MLAALSNASRANPNISSRSVVVLAPLFSKDRDSGLGAGQQSAGANNANPGGIRASGFDALDQLISDFDDVSLFLNLK